MPAYKILIVDDIENNRFTLDIMLSVLGKFDVEEAESGPEALEKLNQTTYDLVLLDIMMPGMTGIEVLEKLDLATSSLNTKFIVVSALQDMEIIVKALELGALDYLPKPIEEALLAARLKQLLERRETDEELRKNKERIDSDLKKAADIQKSLCPEQTLSFKSLSGEICCELAGSMQPAYEVGGDFYDYFELPDGNIVVVIADACGKGAPAAIYASRVHDLLRMVALHNASEAKSSSEESLLTMLTAVNTILSENNDACWFVTTWAGIYSPEDRVLTWCSAGHCDALLQNPDNSVEPLSIETGLPIGLDETFSAKVDTRVLPLGSKLHLYTDGITEHRKDDGGFVGEDGLIQLFEQLATKTLSIEDNVKALTHSVLGMNSMQPPEDDITLLSLSVVDTNT
ncbi:MAG: SpoIIE family protein phosphatase [Granulosicoccus sp.]